MLKVAFNARFLRLPSMRGLNRYTMNLLQELADLDCYLFLYSDQPLQAKYLEKLPKDSYQVSIAPSMPYVLWEQYWLPKQCKKDEVDIFHCPINFGLPWLSPCPCVLTLHDAIDQAYYHKYIPWYQHLDVTYNIRNKLYPWVARTRAKHIITDSHYSKEDIIKYFQVPEDKITVIYIAADSRFQQQVDEKECLRLKHKYQLESPYIFYIGGCEKRKNVPFLVKAFAEANLENIDLVIAGGNAEQCDMLSKLAESLKIANRLRLLGMVDDEDLPGLYSEAICFVNPSEYEGFGLQLCEAMGVNCPTLAARATSLPEILGDAGETFTLDNTHELVNLFRKISSDPLYRNQLSIQAKKRSQEFNWQVTAEQTKAIYQKLLNH